MSLLGIGVAGFNFTTWKMENWREFVAILELDYLLNFSSRDAVETRISEPVLREAAHLLYSFYAPGNYCWKPKENLHFLNFIKFFVVKKIVFYVPLPYKQHH